jgi:hypothetical protein
MRFQVNKQKKAYLSQSFVSLDQNSGEVPVFGSCLNIESRMQFLAAWRPILRNLFLAFRKHF